MLAAVASRPDVGAVATRMLFVRDGRINSAGLGIDRLGVAYDRHIGEPADAGEGPPVDVFGASGGGALLRRAMLADVGGFDDSFFLYLEDADLAWRARMRGWATVYVPAAVVRHHHSASSGHGSPFKYELVGRNRVRMLAKNMGTPQLLRRAPAILAYDLGYVVVVATLDRTLAPLRGRLSGLREWRRYRRIGAGRLPVELDPPLGLRAAMRRRRASAAR
jgi:GT2 family glycosyltransferase